MRKVLYALLIMISLVVSVQYPASAQLAANLPNALSPVPQKEESQQLSLLQAASDSVYDNDIAEFHHEISHVHGLTLRKRGSAVEYIALVGDEQILVGSTATHGEDRARLKEEFTRQTTEKIEQLERRFGLSISREQILRHGPKTCPEATAISSIALRIPHLGELLALEYALERSLPPGKSQLQIFFSKTATTPGALAKWELSASNKPTIIVEPASHKRSHELEYVLMHELSHHSQYKMGYNPMTPFEWRFCEMLGWHSFKNPLTGETDWSIATQTGTRYKYSMPLHCWVSCNKSGQPVDAAGSRVKHQYDAVRLSGTEIVKVAKVRPCTNYVDSPLEVLAEGLAMFRMTGTHRARLLQTSPELYALVKDFDQRQLDRHFGAGFIRAANGQVVSSTAVTAEGVRMLEQKIIASANIQ